MNFDLGVSLIAILGLLVLTAIVSGSETGLTAVSRSKLAELERKGNRRAAVAGLLAENRERLVGALLLVRIILYISVTAIAVATLDPVWGTLGEIAAALAVLVVFLVVSEILPRSVAIACPERVALTAAPFINGLVLAFGPPVAAVQLAAKRLLRRLGFDIGDTQNVLSPQDELRGAIDMHLKGGTVVKNDRDMLGGVLDLQELENADIMIHRTKMTMIDGDDDPKEIVTKVLKSGHTRIPVWKDTPDNIIGVLHARDLFAALQANGGDASRIDIEDITTPPWFVPDTRAVPDQLNAFLRRKIHFAIVVDEYGEVQGLITLEDIIEEIVGDIKDEHDAVATGVRPKPDGSYLVDGAVPIRDINRAFGWSLPDDEANTVAGLVIHEARTIPDVGQAFSFHGFRFEILKKRKHQVTAIRMSPLRRDGAALEDG